MTTIAEKLTTIDGALGDIKTAIEAKGVTPSGDITTYATAIGNISGGGSFIGIPREVSNGVYQMPTTSFTFSLPNNVTSICDSGLRFAFYGCPGLMNVDLSSITSVGNYGLGNAFQGCNSLTNVDLSALASADDYGLQGVFRDCTGLTSIDLSSLTSVGMNGLNNAFGYCISLTSIDLSALTDVGTNGLNSAFSYCESLTSIDFPSLTNISSKSFNGAFPYCTALTDIYFRALTTTSFGSFVNQFSAMMRNTGTSVTHTLHFPSNMESTISGLTDYPLFGGASGYVTLAFDLPATE